MSHLSNLSEGEEKLLHAVIAATKKGAIDGKFAVKKLGYEFHLELDGYSKVIVDPTEKQDFETALKTLCERGMLRSTDSHVGAAPQWEYELAGEAREQVKSPS